MTTNSGVVLAKARTHYPREGFGGNSVDGIDTGSNRQTSRYGSWPSPGRRLRLLRQLADTPSRPRGAFRPSFASSFPPLVQEGAGKAGCRLAPAVRCAKAHAGKPHSSIQV